MLPSQRCTPLHPGRRNQGMSPSDAQTERLALEAMSFLPCLIRSRIPLRQDRPPPPRKKRRHFLLLALDLLRRLRPRRTRPYKIEFRSPRPTSPAITYRLVLPTAFDRARSLACISKIVVSIRRTRWILTLSPNSPEPSFSWGALPDVMIGEGTRNKKGTNESPLPLFANSRVRSLFAPPVFLGRRLLLLQTIFSPHPHRRSQSQTHPRTP